VRAIKNVIFDLDGTLIDSSDGVVAAVNYALQKTGDSLPPPEEIRSFIGYSLDEMFPHFSKAPTDILHRYFQEKANDLVVGATVALPEAEETLALLHERGYRLAIATTKVVRNIDGILDKLNWRRYFEVYSGGNEVKNVKPDPEIFRLTLSRLGAKRSETVVIGDTINDILGARAIPMTAIAVASPFEKREKVMSAHPDFFVESILGVVDLLETIIPRMEDPK